jgi:hypothetical protein
MGGGGSFSSGGPGKGMHSRLCKSWALDDYLTLWIAIENVLSLHCIKSQKTVLHFRIMSHDAVSIFQFLCFAVLET